MGGGALRISVIVPTRNEAGYIERTLAAIGVQTNPCCEVIVVDTLSDDETVSIAKRMGARVVIEPRRGVPFARETGRRAAIGDVLTFVDADTIVPRNYLERVAAFLEAHPDLVAVSNPFDYYEGSPTLRTAIRLFFRLIFAPYNAFLAASGRSFLFGGNFSIRREAVDRIGGFESPYEFYGEDAETSRRLSAAGLSAGFMSDLFSETSARRFNRLGGFALARLYLVHHLAVMFRRALPRSG